MNEGIGLNAVFLVVCDVKRTHKSYAQLCNNNHYYYVTLQCALLFERLYTNGQHQVSRSLL